MAKAYKPLPAAEELWELFEYKPLTGELVWRKPTSNRVKAGDVVGSLGRNNGVDVRVHGNLYRAHRLVWRWVTTEDPCDLELDHINGNRRDNRYQNLRLATRAQNMWNISWSGTSLGVEQQKCHAGGITPEFASEANPFTLEPLPLKVRQKKRTKKPPWSCAVNLPRYSSHGKK